MQAAVLRFGVVAVTLGAVALTGGSARAEPQDSRTDGPTFVVSCSLNGRVSDSADIGPLTCTLKVTGLPDPLDDEFVFVWSTGTDPPDDPSGSSPVSTTVSAVPPNTAPGDPALMQRDLSPTLSPLRPTTPGVPEPPPKYL